MSEHSVELAWSWWNSSAWSSLSRLEKASVPPRWIIKVPKVLLNVAQECGNPSSTTWMRALSSTSSSIFAKWTMIKSRFMRTELVNWHTSNHLEVVELLSDQSSTTPQHTQNALYCCRVNPHALNWWDERRWDYEEKHVEAFLNAFLECSNSMSCWWCGGDLRRCSRFSHQCAWCGGSGRCSEASSSCLTSGGGYWLRWSDKIPQFVGLKDLLDPICPDEVVSGANKLVHLMEVKFCKIHWVVS